MPTPGGDSGSPESAALAAVQNNAVYVEMAAASHTIKGHSMPASPVHPLYMDQQDGAYAVYVPPMTPIETIGGVHGQWASGPSGLHQRSDSFQSEQSLYSENSLSSERSMDGIIGPASHSKLADTLGDRKLGRSVACAICDEPVGLDANGSQFSPCSCGFPVCRPCYEYVRKHEGNCCPRCKQPYTQKKGSGHMEAAEAEDGEDKGEEVGQFAPATPAPSSSAGDAPYMPAPQHTLRLSIEGPPGLKVNPARAYLQSEANGRIVPVEPRMLQAPAEASLGPPQSSTLDVLDPSKKGEDYGYGSILWKPERAQQMGGLGPLSGGGGGGGGSDDGLVGNGDLRRSPSGKDYPVMDESRKPLSRKVPVSSSLVNPYRFVIVVRFVIMVAFLGWRVSNPNPAAYGLWLVSVICEIWFAFSWLLDQAPKWSPITRETFLDRLHLRYEKPGEPSELAPMDIFVSTADAEKEPPLVTANVILSILAADYPVDRLACYLSDDGAAMLTFEALTETASFARFWVPFCKKFAIEPRCPEEYFKQAKTEYLKDKIHPDFVRDRRQMKREYEEFKVRINALVAKSKNKPKDGWKMADGTPWPGNIRSDHVGMIQVFLQPDGDTVDIEGNPLPRLVYVSREKRPSYDHNKKAGAMNALIRASALITNAPYILNLDCDHYVNDSKAFRNAMCFMMDPLKGSQVCYVQFPQRFDGIDTNDRYANRNMVFYDVTCKGLDGVQGPMYVGTGCCFRRQALYGFSPPNKEAQAKPKERSRSCLSLCCNLRRKARKTKKKKDSSQSLVDDHDLEEMQLVPTKWHAKRFGVCHNFVTTTFEIEGGVPAMSPRTVLSDVILVISCGYEDNTDWGKEIGWVYGSITEDIVTGFVMHSRGWRSVYCLTQRAAFKGTAPINMADRLHQVLRWGLGSVEIFFSKHNPLWFNLGGGLKFIQRVAYVNTTVYPFTAVPLTIYCFLPALCLLLNQFIIADINSIAIVFFVLFFVTIFATAILEIRWSGVSLEEFWRNEQFWVIGGTSSHLAAVWQGLLKVLAGFDSQFTLTQKDSGDDGEFAELYTFRFTWLIIPPTTIIIINILGIVAGLSRVFNEANPNWGQLFGKIFFAIWVLLHLYPFAKGLMGRHNKTPTIVIVWSSLLAISLSLLWVRLL